MAELIRVAALAGFLPTMAALGSDPAPLLRDAGLSLRFLGQAEQMIPARTVMRLLEAAADQTGCATFALRMAECRGIANLGATSLLIAHQPTLRDAFASLSRYRNRINATLVLHMDDFGDKMLIREDFLLDQPTASRQASELTLGVLARLCKTVLGDEWQAETVCFTHSAPPKAEMPIYQRVFGCRPEFDAECNGLIINPRDLDRPNKQADSALADHARTLIESVMSPDRQSLAQQVGQAILLLMPSGRANIQSCSDMLGMTVRTLQRTLDAENTSFSTLLGKAREQLAAQYLSNPRTRITDIAEMLGYSSIGAFTRWHLQTFGMTPRQRRQASTSAGRVPSVGHQSP